MKTTYKKKFFTMPSSIKKQIVKKFKVKLISREKDTELKMNKTYHVPITKLGELIGYLEQFKS